MLSPNCISFCSFIGKIKAHVNLLALFTKPITVQVDTIVFVLQVTPPNHWDAETCQAMIRKFKENALADNQAAAIVNTLKGGFLWKIAMKLVKNVMVEVKNVHVRIEDCVTRKDRGLAIGKAI